MGEDKDTPERLLDTAERLFGERGLEVSLREITREAGANVAAVSYHFGSKDELLAATFTRRMGPLNDERLRLLDLTESAAGDAPPTLESVLRAFTGPTFRLVRQHPSFMQLVGHIEIHQTRFEHLWQQEARFPELVARMRATLLRILPEWHPNDIWWSVSFLIGGMVHTWMCRDTIERMSAGEAAYGSDDEMIERLVRYAAAGMRALAKEATQ